MRTRFRTRCKQYGILWRANFDAKLHPTDRQGNGLMLKVALRPSKCLGSCRVGEMSGSPTSSISKKTGTMGFLIEVTRSTRTTGAWQTFAASAASAPFGSATCGHKQYRRWSETPYSRFGPSPPSGLRRESVTVRVRRSKMLWNLSRTSASKSQWHCPGPWTSPNGIGTQVTQGHKKQAACNMLHVTCWVWKRRRGTSRLRDATVKATIDDCRS